MTAVFAVWNNYGFSLASDSNQTAGMNNQNWVDPVEKTFMLRNHQLAIAGAGATFHQGVEVNEIFRTWEETLPADGYGGLEQYFVNFAHWFSKQEFATEESSIADLKNKLETWFEVILQVIQEHGTNINTESLENTFYEKYACSRNSLNVFGGEWEQLAESSELSEGVLRDSYLKIQELRNLIVELDPEIESNEQYRILNDHPYTSEVATAVSEAFLDVFGNQFDDESNLDVKILQLALCMIENWQLDEQPIEILMIGYGREDWLPSAVQFSIQPKLFGLPRLFITDTSNPNQNWYMKIAVDSAVYQLTRGISREMKEELISVTSEFVDDDINSKLATEIENKLSQKFHSTLSKIEYLTIDRLEFVSRLFVQVEALKSFLDQPVAGVGGDTKVISMTKNSRRERYFREFQ